MHEHPVAYTQQSHFVTSHAPTGLETEIWLVLHGYGQLSEFFIRKFRPVFDASRLIIAAEGIHRSYREGFSGRVGANWMTKYRRETDIGNGMRYLDAVVDSVLKYYNALPVVNVFGFSQGAATVSRWVAHTHLPVAKMVLWGGGLAHDLDGHVMREVAKGIDITLVAGDNDPFIPKELIEEQLQRLKNFPFKSLHERTFNGAHDLNEQLLLEIIC
nr:alpha/beta hydrolase [Cytophagales bacterium]